MSLSHVLACFAVLTLLAVTPAAAHGPTPQKVEQSIAIAAPPETVWAAVKDFDGLAGWNPLVESSKGSGGNAADGTRVVVLKSGGQLIDSLDEYLDDEMSYSYRLATPDIESFPASFYSSTLMVKPGANGGSEVIWDARLYRADTGNFPSETQNDQAAIEAVTRYFQEGLKTLKEQVEAQ
ncbi:MxaD protein [Methyloceanibacter superfactus]|uniref:MxaD protein n=1 Tax=Methyloceanibacter superfactus TaxID=1774969 RepID=A0A1E3VYD8_9HYPH|nr:SRPBCC family protein [Methyloceanibacter superfactus]ODR98281.1 MxaD protein [Methyloceanibacter superfactus]